MTNLYYICSLFNIAAIVLRPDIYNTLSVKTAKICFVWCVRVCNLYLFTLVKYAQNYIFNKLLKTALNSPCFTLKQDKKVYRINLILLKLS